jgi:tetratricopeptide (TPR) repeat protein
MASPRGLNSIAYTLAYSGKVDEAIKLLQIAIDLYPKEANLYDSTGELYLVKNDKEKSIEYYRKALEIDPETQSAKAMLKKLGVLK